jgi:alkaline phosphatase D
VLDMRGHRDFNRKDGQRILGKDQMNRVLTWLDSPQAKASPALFIVSPVPVVHVNSFIVNKLDLAFLGLADDLRDEWDHESNGKSARSPPERRVRAFGCHRQDRGLPERGRAHRRGVPPVPREPSEGQGVPAHLERHHLPGLDAAEIRGQGSRQAGAPGGEPADQLTAFNKIHVMTRNNFGIVAAHPDAPPAEQVSWDLYGSTGEEDEIVRLKRIWLA